MLNPEFYLKENTLNIFVMEIPNNKTINLFFCQDLNRLRLGINYMSLYIRLCQTTYKVHRFAGSNFEVKLKYILFGESTLSHKCNIKEQK